MDYRTLYIFDIASLSVYTCVLVALALRNRRVIGMGWFATALGLELAHVILGSFRDLIPKWAAIVLPNQMHILSCFAIFMGFRWFVVRRTMRRALPTVLLAASLGLYLLLAMRKNPHAFASSMAPVLLLDAMTILLLLRAGGIFQTASRTAAALLSVEFGLACYRTILIAVIYTSGAPAMTDPHWLFTMFALMVVDTSIVPIYGWFLLIEIQHTLRDSARRDPLTGLFNRRAFDDEFAREFSRATRLRSPFSVIAVDIDHFKSINDRFGHAVGDKALASVGELLRTEIRKMDIPVRIGGDEFALLLPDTDLHSATALAQKLLRRLSAQRLPTGHGLVDITFTAGVAEMIASDTGWESLLERADANLYSGKLGGRNQVADSGSYDALAHPAKVAQNA